LSSLRWLKERLAQQLEAVNTAQAASDLVNLRYGAGLATYLQVLATENATLTQKRQLVTLQSRALSLQANLSRALGGGYRPEFPTTAPALPTVADNHDHPNTLPRPSRSTQSVLSSPVSADPGHRAVNGNLGDLVPVGT
jgi:hypothetical protein